MGERKIVVIPANPEKVKLYKVGIYCRVSTSIREQLYSIAAQAKSNLRVTKESIQLVIVHNNSTIYFMSKSTLILAASIDITLKM